MTGRGRLIHALAILLSSAGFPSATMAQTGRSAPGYYPAEALRAAQEGRVGIEVTISPEGRATHCTVINSSGYASLDEGACKEVMRLGRFTPAKDDSGKPVEAKMSLAVNFRLASRP